MNHHDAKFLLRARRPEGRDAADPIFAEALAAAANDPLLKAWHEREERFDSAIAGKLAHIAPPAGLKEAILAGARASEARRARWRQPGWLAAAAGVVLLLAVAGRWFATRGAAIEDFAGVALSDLATAHDEHVGFPAELADVQARLANVALPLRGKVGLQPEELRKNRCRSVRWRGREVFEICFQREGTWFHLYAMRGGSAGGDRVHEAVSKGSEPLAVAAWSEATMSYALVTSAGREALRRVL